MHVLVGASLIGVATLAGCGQQTERAGAPADYPAYVQPASPDISSRPGSTSAAPAPPPLDDAGPDEGNASPAPPEADSAQQARSRATALMRAFARTDLPQEQWWDGVAGYFTPAARPIYQSTDVANVPVHKVVEGSAQLLPDSTKFRAAVTVDTDNGAYTVTLVRADGDWLVDRATPPKS